jgi:hypothetical protein
MHGFARRCQAAWIPYPAKTEITDCQKERVERDRQLVNAIADVDGAMTVDSNNGIIL